MIIRITRDGTTAGGKPRRVGTVLKSLHIGEALDLVAAGLAARVEDEKNTTNTNNTAESSSADTKENR